MDLVLVHLLHVMAMALFAVLSCNMDKITRNTSFVAAGVPYVSVCVCVCVCVRTVEP